MSTWNPSRDFFFDISRFGTTQGPLYQDSQGTSGTPKFRFVAGDRFLVNLWFRDRSSGSAVVVDLPTDSVIAMTGRAVISNVRTKLFETTDFALVGTGDSACWQGIISLMGEAIASYFTSNPSSTSLAISVDCEISNPGNTLRTTFQFAIEVTPQNYTGGDPVVEDDPPYPAGNQVLCKSFAGSLPITGGASAMDLDYTSMGLASAPRAILVSVQTPSGADGIMAWLNGVPGLTGSNIVFSAPIPASGEFNLYYLIIPA